VSTRYGARVRVKICGVTDIAGAQAAVAAGADAIGFVFAPSPRRVDLERALAIAATIPPFVARVVVFRHPDPAAVLEVAATLRPDVVQTEVDASLLEALAGRIRLLPVVHDGPDLERDVAYVQGALGDRNPVLIEAAGPGGRGAAPDPERAAALARRVPLVLAGGLRPDNVAAAIALVAPYAVDVSSGVESSPGVKDPDLVAAFVKAAMGCPETGSKQGRP
jgi:phosphoribosylanthranilate isomerase